MLVFEGGSTHTCCVGELLPLDLLCILINKTGTISRLRFVNIGIIKAALTLSAGISWSQTTVFCIMNLRDDF
jgi:hypothetical protein